jgi:hypothetical protein
MRVDLHTHTNYSPDSLTNITKFLARCEAKGLDCVAITDHNTIQGALQAQTFSSIRIIVGEEIKSQDGEIIGLFLQSAIPRGLSSTETVLRIKEQGGLVSIPHPFDHFRGSVIRKDALENVLPYVDIIEGFNARNTWNTDNHKAQEFAQANGILTTSVSDSHTLTEIGRNYMEIPEFDGTPDSFIKALASGKPTTNKITPLIHVLTTLTKVQKKTLHIFQR